MKPTTIWGTAARLGGVVGVRDIFYAIDDLEPELENSAIDVGHEPGTECGTIVYAELAPPRIRSGSRSSASSKAA